MSKPACPREAAAGSPLPPTPAPLFRDAMSRVPAAVHVVTTDGPAGRAGFTATAVASVSDEPPTVLVCLHGRNRAAPVFAANGCFCVNALAAADEDLARHFAGRAGRCPSAPAAGELFAEGEWARLATGAPVLARALAAFDCRLVEACGIATHRVLVGEVVGVALGAPGAGLVYKARRYTRA